MLDQFAALRGFVAVAESGSFSGAARQMKISTSMVSRQIAALEGKLGVRLFERTTRAVALTEAGRNYLDRAQRVLAELEAANLWVSRLQDTPRGRLRISAPLSFGVQHLSPALPLFLSRFPEIEIDLALNDRYVDLIDEGFDLALRIGRLADSSLIARKLSPIRRAVCASPDYIARRGAPSHPNELVAHECLSHSEIGPREWRFLDENGQTLLIEVKSRFRADNGDVLRQMALAGVGIIYLPTFFIGQDIAAGRLVSLLPPFALLDSALQAIYPPGRHLSPKVRVFVDFLAETFGMEPYWDRGTHSHFASEK
jgi:DNA-binding transcriptional LysR family regulator